MEATDSRYLQRVNCCFCVPVRCGVVVLICWLAAELVFKVMQAETAITVARGIHITLYPNITNTTEAEPKITPKKKVQPTGNPSWRDGALHGLHIGIRGEEIAREKAYRAWQESIKSRKSNDDGYYGGQMTEDELEEFFKENPPTDGERLIYMLFVAATFFLFVPQVYVAYKYTVYSWERNDGVMDTSKDRIFLPKGMTIMMCKEIVSLLVECALILAYFSHDSLGLELAIYFVVVSVIFHLLFCLLYCYWKMSFNTYYEQLADFEYTQQ